MVDRWLILIRIQMSIAFTNVKVKMFSNIFIITTEILVNMTLDYCNCVAPFFPDSIDRSRYRNCTIYDHISCIKIRLLDFNQTTKMKCNCKEDCIKSEPIGAVF